MTYFGNGLLRGSVRTGGLEDVDGRQIREGYIRVGHQRDTSEWDIRGTHRRDRNQRRSHWGRGLDLL
eukprot:1017735-Amorphochlora_amoeboformis.AAC.1